jgi:hypothetical protein
MRADVSDADELRKLGRGVSWTFSSPGTEGNLFMPFDLFMDDTCPKCRKPVKFAGIEPHPNRRDLAVHKFHCANCGATTTRILFRKPSGVAA